MDQSFEIKSSAFPYDMSSWCTEKMAVVVLGLARIAEAVSGETSTDTAQMIAGELSSALNDATKMLAFSCGANWDPSDREIVVKNGTLGYEELQVKYGLIREAPEQQRIFDQGMFVAECRKLLAGERAPNRTLMYDLLHRARFREPLLQALEDELEKVTMGSVEWSAFVSCSLEILLQIEKGVSNRPKS